MDEFAQTRGSDDLFDDEIIPVIEPIAVPVPVAEPTPPPKAPAPTSTPKVASALKQRPGDLVSKWDTPNPSERGGRGGRGGERGRGGRGRGRGRGNAVPPVLPPAAQAAESEPNESPDKPEPQSEPIKEEPSSEEQTEEAAERAEGEDTVDATAVPAPEKAAPRPTAVRGDRSATGGIKKVRQRALVLKVGIVADKALHLSQSLQKNNSPNESQPPKSPPKRIARHTPAQPQTKPPSNRVKPSLPRSALPKPPIAKSWTASGNGIDSAR